MININIRKSIKCGSDYSLFISFPYNDTILNIIRVLPTRFWNKDEKTWEVPVNKLPYLINEFSDFDVQIDVDNADIISESKKVICEVPSTFEFKTSPFNHQIEGFNFGLSHDRWLLADEQGLGKTKQVIDIAVAKKYQRGYKHCLIICGVNGLKWNWKNEVSVHSNESAHILGQKTKAGRLVVGSNNDKLSDLENINNINDYFIITNVESLRNESITSKIVELCNNNIIGIVAIDEVHKCKDPQSQQGKGILKVNPECKIAMTGTPLMNTPMDLYIILKWLGYEKHSFYQFRNHHCVMGGYGGYQVVGYKNLDELQERLTDIMLRRLKSDVLDLPDKLFIDEYVEMTAKQSVIYKEVSMDIKNNIDQIKMVQNPLAELIRMRQATGFTGILSSTIKESAKLDRMEELVDEAVENGKKVVIFSNWTQMTDVIVERIRKKYDYAIITGDTSDSSRQTMVDDFQNNPNCKVIIGTIGAMGTGLTLTAGTVEIFLDEPWTMAAKEQAIDRCHRIGQNNNVTVYTLIAKDTIDERIHEIVYKKGTMSKALVDNEFGNMNNTQLLDFLLS